MISKLSDPGQEFHLGSWPISKSWGCALPQIVQNHEIQGGARPAPKKNRSQKKIEKNEKFSKIWILGKLKYTPQTGIFTYNLWICSRCKEPHYSLTRISRPFWPVQVTSSINRTVQITQIDYSNRYTRLDGWHHTMPTVVNYFCIQSQRSTNLSAVNRLQRVARKAYPNVLNDFVF